MTYLINMTLVREVGFGFTRTPTDIRGPRLVIGQTV